MGERKDWPPLNCKRNSLRITFRKLMFFFKIWCFQQKKRGRMGERKDWPPLNCKRNSLWITFRKLMFFLKMWWYFQQVKQLTTCINHNSSKSQRIRPRFCRFAGLAVLYCIATLERADSTRKDNFQKKKTKNRPRGRLKEQLESPTDVSQKICYMQNLVSIVLAHWNATINAVDSENWHTGSTTLDSPNL